MASSIVARLDDDQYSTCNSNPSTPQIPLSRSAPSFSDISKSSREKWTKKDPAFRVGSHHYRFHYGSFAVRLWVFDYFKDGLGIPEERRGGDDEKS